jgi:hypothetical protein
MVNRAFTCIQLHLSEIKGGGLPKKHRTSIAPERARRGVPIRALQGRAR